MTRLHDDTSSPRSLHELTNGDIGHRDIRYLSRDDCDALFRRIVSLASGGGHTLVSIESVWRGNIRWALNRITTSGDTTDHTVTITRVIRGAYGSASTNKLDAAGLILALHTAERHLQLDNESPDDPSPPASVAYLKPNLFFGTSLALDAVTRSNVGRTAVAPIVGAGLVSAGYVEVGAHTRAVLNSAGLSAYYAATTAQYSVTVRSAQDTASGWAGVDANDWSRIDAAAISQRALRKCCDSENPKAIEPGHYTAVLEPQAVHDIFFPAISALDRYSAETMQTAYTFAPGQSKIGKRMLDPRVTVSTDPTDPDCGYIPFNNRGEPYQATKWFADGVLADLAYDSTYALTQLGLNLPRPNPYAYRMSGGDTTLDDMIASTRRGLLITRLSEVDVIDPVSLICGGVTRDGVWYIENGKIKYPVKNFRFSESPLIVFNKVEAIGIPQRVFARYPTVVPPVKIHDFNFTSLADVV